jgi:hypothetical protein
LLQFFPKILTVLHIQKICLFRITGFLDFVYRSMIEVRLELG